MNRVPAGAQPLWWLVRVHGLTLRNALIILVSWVVAAVLVVVGIPRVDPNLAYTPRPMETLGTVGLCLPACLHAWLLRDQAPWLAAVSPRPRWVVRLAWLCVVAAAGCAGAVGWLLALPRDVPAGHAFAFWLLLLSLSILSAVAAGHGLAIVLPLVLVAVSSFGDLVPFEYNMVYNVDRTDQLALFAGVTLLLAVLAFLRRGVQR